MRYRMLMPLALALCVVGTTAAQATEIIIRRPGQKDQVIHIDPQQARVMSDKAAAEIASTARAMEGRLADLQLEKGVLARSLDDSAMRGELARTAEIASRNLSSAKVAAGMAGRILRSVLVQPRLGIVVNTAGPQDADKYGAQISAVTPGGPADKAGLRSGDIITKIAGKAVATGNSDVLPGTRLIELVSRLEIGKAVDVEYRRGSDTRTTKVTPADLPDDAYASVAPTMIFRQDTVMSQMLRRLPNSPNGVLAVPGGDMRNFWSEVPGAAAGNFVYAFGSSAFGSMELAPLNEKLGSYFGTSDGVLVINTGDKDAYGLQPGDVIQTVDGRKATSPAQLMRILRTYDKGEEFKLQIMRQKKAETLTVKLP